MRIDPRLQGNCVLLINIVFQFDGELCNQKTAREIDHADSGPGAVWGGGEVHGAGDGGYWPEREDWEPSQGDQDVIWGLRICCFCLITHICTTHNFLLFLHH